ncbi:monovalent cation/H(+) antiporter subunit G [Streptomyces xiaopingdaonensis]|uniref:monovalent cation/H(+) antiporter subunit G n=1 Tax=Streptomyces xiaopingdaonensis TaxID=1565415 RepID=UPI00031D76C6|nr:monovalent cation/H(+) antiporter subunit G [Streptomyces xiaopingdaonensis]
MNWAAVVDWTGAVLMLLGALLCLVAGIGLIRLPDVLTRMHAATKPQALGLLFVLGGAALWLRTAVDVTTLIVIAIFQLVTTPVAAHMVGRAGYRGRLDRQRLVLDELGEAIEEAEQRREAQRAAERRGEAEPVDAGERREGETGGDASAASGEGSSEEGGSPEGRGPSAA